MHRKYGWRGVRVELQLEELRVNKFDSVLAWFALGAVGMSYIVLVQVQFTIGSIQG